MSFFSIYPTQIQITVEKVSRQSEGCRLTINTSHLCVHLYVYVSMYIPECNKRYGLSIDGWADKKRNKKRSLAKGGKVETQLDVKIETEAPFQLQAVRSLLGGGGVLGGQGQEEQQPEGPNEEEDAAEGLGDRPLGIPTIAEVEAGTQLDRQVGHRVLSAIL